MISKTQRGRKLKGQPKGVAASWRRGGESPVHTPTFGEVEVGKGREGWGQNDKMSPKAGEGAEEQPLNKED